MTFGIITFGLLGFALLAAALVMERRKTARTLRELERSLSKRLGQVEASLADVSAQTEVRNLAVLLDGVTSVSHRLERRMSRLNGGDSQPLPESGEN